MIVLLSIKPEFANRIFEGTKKYEYRKVIFRERGVNRILLYASSPVKRIVGELEVSKVLADTPSALWHATWRHSGVDETFFFEYFSGRDKGYAIKIRQATPYKNPINPYKKIRGFRAPQSFAYLEPGGLLHHSCRTAA